MLDIGPEAAHAGQRVADCRRKRRLAGDDGDLSREPGLEVVEDGPCLRLPDLDATVGRRTADDLLDGVVLRNPADRFFGDRRALRPVDVDGLAPDVGHARDFADVAGAIELIEAGIAVGLNWHPFRPDTQA